MLMWDTQRHTQVYEVYAQVASQFLALSFDMQSLCTDLQAPPSSG